MRVLIVGCGYVGLALGRRLSSAGHQVWGVRRSGSATGELSASGIVPVQADVTMSTSLSALPEALDWVVFCASASGAGLEDYRRVYVEGLRNLLEWAMGRPIQKLVYTGSTSVYGQQDGSWVSETSSTCPGSETARILLEAEQLVLAAARDRHVSGVVLRVAGIYGPGRGYWLKQFLKGEAKLDGQGERLLNMIHRDDVAGAIAAALQSSRPGEIYNAVDNEPVSQRALFQWLAARLGRSLPPQAAEEPDSARRRALTSKRVSNRRLREELGYEFLYPTFREGFSAELERLP